MLICIYFVIFKTWVCISFCVKLLKRMNKLGSKKRTNVERQKLSFPEESVENADFYKPVLNQIVATHE